MIETRLLARLLATARTVTALSAVPALRETGAEQSELVRAQVAARLADGTFRVLVDGRPLKLALPADAKPGDVVELRVVNRGAGAQGDGPVARGDASALSSAGRFISTLLSTTSSAAPQQAKPILEVPPTAPAELPGPLARALERSGMFYESHQARWVEGDYPLERLLQEPQNAQNALATTGSKAPAQDSADPERSSAQQSATSLPSAHSSAKDAPSRSPSAPAASPADEAREQLVARDALPLSARDARDALPLLRSQLEALDSRHITWLGQIWPGQPMRWEIEADDSSRREPDREAGWNTRFSLELPALGEIGADMALAHGGIRVHLRARTADSAALMRAAGAELTQALIAAGVAPVHIEVRCDEPAA
jgi:hypothetical protein